MIADVSIPLQQLKAIAMEEFGEIFEGLYLFGSYARKTATEESDVDVLLVLKGIEDVKRYTYYDRISMPKLLLELKHHVVISLMVMSAGKFYTSDSLFLESVREDAIQV